MTMRVADYLMSRLAAAGAEHVFLLPGGGAMYLNDALACEKRLTPVPCHHEQACGIAAEAWGRVRGSFGVCMVTTGPGATNVITPVAGAWIESVPLLVISGQVKRPDRLAGRPLRQGGVQEVDIVPLVDSITKYAVTVDDPQQIRYHLERALYEMRNGRHGPVWLDIPLDVQGAPIDPETLPGFTPEPVAAPALSADCEQLLARIACAERPLLLAGHGVRLAGAAQSFAALAERLGIPVATTWNALDLLPWEHPLNVGRPGVVALRAANFAVQNCDLLISLGCRLDNIITAYNPRGFARAADKVVVDVDAHEIDKLDMAISQRIVADAKALIDALAEHPVPARTHAQAPWLARCADWKRRYPVNDGLPFASDGPINHYQCVAALSEAIPADTVVSTGSSGLAIEVFYTIFRNKPGQRVFLTSGLGSMGYGLPAAIGACLANGSAPMVAIESDGSLQLNLQEFATLAASRLPISLIVLNNGGYASIRNTQRNYFASRFIGTGPEAGLQLPDPEKIAATYDLPFVRLSDARDLAQLSQILATPGPRLIDIQLAPNETLAPKVAALSQADGSMLSMPLEDMSPLLPLEQLTAEMLIPLLPASRQARPDASAPQG
ncbi:thiamine pyrophosphate-binding protein [Rhodocyclus tenuis]|uniref:Thiamine pyrophosphate-binding protein n=3 Tax=Rhodocyclus TaxID=1064 RepID=A0A6L5JX12_RHOTE|nr:thiamine pyrophosphate-binding protein [Rhodocyclus gracilis]NJA89179.1 thiamine pyrophosphate-binding protein [Rhodocyclus gracilis]